MARLQGPLFSEKASKQLGKKLIYKTKGNRAFLTKYNKPGGVSPFDPSPTQINKRMLYNLIIACWQCKTPAEKKVFDDLVKSKNLNMSGWNYFYQQSLKDLPSYLGLQGYWAFNRIVGGQILDLSGNDNHGDLLPSYPANCPTLVDSLNKKFGKAGNFDGNDDYVDLGTPIIPTTDFTIEAWIRWSTLTPRVVVQQYQSGEIGRFLFRLSHTKKIEINLSDGTFIANTALAPNKWHHATVTRKNGTGKIYLEGLLDITPFYNASNVYQGTNTKIGGNYQFFRGDIDEVHIYDREVPEEEIKKHADLKIV